MHGLASNFTASLIIQFPLVFGHLQCQYLGDLVVEDLVGEPKGGQFYLILDAGPAKLGETLRFGELSVQASTYYFGCSVLYLLYFGE